MGFYVHLLKGVIQADFEFFDPKPDDFHGVKVLLQNYLDNEQWDLSAFVDLILGQTTVGTVVKIEDDGLFAVVTALNLGRYKASDLFLIFFLSFFLLPSPSPPPPFYVVSVLLWFQTNLYVSLLVYFFFFFLSVGGNSAATKLP